MSKYTGSAIVTDTHHEKHEKPKVDATTGLSENHLSELISEHGLHEITIADAGLRSASSNELNLLFKRGDVTSDGIFIPYSSDYCRTKLDVPLMREGGRVTKYLSPSDSQDRLYIPKSVEPILGDSSIPLFITGDEIKALKLTQEGLPCIGLAGICSFCLDKLFLTDFDRIELKNRKVYIILDSDSREANYEGE